MIRKEDIRKINTTGASDSYYLTIPKYMIRHLKWKKGQKVVLGLKDKTITINDWVEGEK